jgi:hypothetical protein
MEPDADHPLAVISPLLAVTAIRRAVTSCGQRAKKPFCRPDKGRAAGAWRPMEISEP